MTIVPNYVLEYAFTCSSQYHKYISSGHSADTTLRVALFQSHSYSMPAYVDNKGEVNLNLFW